MKIQLPDPCHESWDQMTPEGQGRHCEACAKVVVDFSKMSDAQVVDYLKASFAKKERVCGRFRPDQVEAPVSAPLPMLKAPVRRTMWMRMAAVFAGLGVFLTSCGQQAARHTVGEITAMPEDTTDQCGTKTTSVDGPGEWLIGDVEPDYDPAEEHLMGDTLLPPAQPQEHYMGKPAPPERFDMGEPMMED